MEASQDEEFYSARLDHTNLPKKVEEGVELQHLQFLRSILVTKFYDYINKLPYYTQPADGVHPRFIV